MAGIQGLILIPLPGSEEKAITSKGSQGSPDYNPRRGSGQTSQGSQRGGDVLPTIPLFPSSDRAVTSSGSVKGVLQNIPSLSFSPQTASSSRKWGGNSFGIISLRNKSTLYIIVLTANPYSDTPTSNNILLGDMDFRLSSDQQWPPFCLMSAK